MDPAGFLEVISMGIWTMLKIGAPVMLIALFVGLIIALFQALTQIQEITLTFVPKIFAIFLSLILLLPYMTQTLLDFGREIFSLIAMTG